MIKLLKEIVAILFRVSGICVLMRETFFRNRVTILVYHDPKPDVFKRHIEYLSSRYNFISLDKLAGAINDKNWSEIPPKSMVITIDDGHKNNYRLLGIFKTYNIRPTIYLCSHVVNTNRKFWFRAGLRSYHHLKKYGSKQRLTILKDEIGYDLQKEYGARQALNLEELKEMSPYVDFQAHSRFHSILTACNDRECMEEISGAKKHLGKLLNKKIRHYSYPNGDYNDREIEYMKKCGYESARTLDIGWNGINSDPYRLKAMSIQDNVSVNILRAQISGFFGYFRYLRYGNFNGAHPPFV